MKFETQKKRILSIDALRGFDMIWIIGFGAFLRQAGMASGSDIGGMISEQMEHVRWDGLNWALQKNEGLRLGEFSKN